MAASARPGCVLIVEVGACGRESAEAAARAGVVEMDDRAEQWHEPVDFRDGLGGVERVEDGALTGTDAVLDGAVVGGTSDRTVDGQDAALGEQVIDDVRIEGGAVVAFEEQRRAVAGDEKSEPAEIVECGLGGKNQRFEVEVGGQIAGKDHNDAGVRGGGTQQHRVNGPGEIGEVPGDVELGIAQAAVEAPAEACQEGLDTAARQRVAEVLNKEAAAACEFRAVNEVRDP